MKYDYELEQFCETDEELRATSVLSAEALMKKINEVSFAADDLLLYLDTHPCDERVLRLMEEKLRKRSELMTLYAEQYGPLTIDDAGKSGGDKWKWMYQPFPWQEGACK